MEVSSPAPWESADTTLSDLATVYREYRAFVWRTLFHRGLDRAVVDDALQDVFLVVYRKLPTFDGRTSLKNWLYGIARRVASEYRRGCRRGTRYLHVVADLDLHAISGKYDRIGHAMIVRELLDTLDEKKREVFILAEVEGMTGPEIAETLGLNQNTVYARLRAARQKFEKALVRHQARQQRELA